MSRIQSYNSLTVLDQNAYSIQSVLAATTAPTLAGVPENSEGDKANAVTCTLTGVGAATTGDLIYMTLDGSVPTALKGLPLRDGAVWQLFQDELQTMRFVSANGGTHDIRFEFAIVA